MLLKFFRQNIRSIHNNFENFHHDVVERNVDIISLNKTWLMHDVLQLHRNFHNYSGTFNCRNSLGGAGVRLYVSNKITYQIIEQCSYSDDDVESIFKAFESQGDNFIIGNIQIYIYI